MRVAQLFGLMRTVRSCRENECRWEKRREDKQLHVQGERRDKDDHQMDTLWQEGRKPKRPDRSRTTLCSNCSGRFQRKQSAKAETVRYGTVLCA